MDDILEAAAARRVEAMRQVNALAQEIARQPDWKGAINSALGRSQALCRAESCGLLLVDGATGELYIEAVSGARWEVAQGVRLPHGQGIAGRAAAQCRSICVPDVAAEPAFDPRCNQITGYRAGSILAVPLILRGDLIGVLEAVRSERRPPFEAVEMEQLELLAPHLAIAVHNGLVMRELRETQAKVLHANEALEQRVAQRTQEIIRAESRLRESERLAAVGQLASGAAHEINNPLGFLTSNLQSLKGYLEGLPKSDAEARERQVTECVAMVDESIDGARRVADIVRSLRELSRLEIHNSAVARVSDSVDRAVRACAWGEVQLDLAVPEDLVAAIAPLQLDQALSHILRNARQAIEGRGSVSVRAWAEHRQVRVSVQDSGCGIDEKHLHHVFEPFFTTRGPGRGTGLGLTAAWGIVSRVGGRIDVESQPGQGATFTVQLPQAAIMR